MIELTLDDFLKIDDRKEAKQVLKSIADQNSDREIGEHWGMSIPQIRKMRVEMGIKKRAANGRKRAVKKQVKTTTDITLAGNLDYDISIQGTLTGEMLHEKLDDLKSLLSTMPGEMFEVKIHSTHS